MKYYIYSKGKDTGNGPFESLEDAQKHLQKLREFALRKSKHNSKYKSSLELLDTIEIVCK